MIIHERERMTTIVAEKVFEIPSMLKVDMPFEEGATFTVHINEGGLTFTAVACPMEMHAGEVFIDILHGVHQYRFGDPRVSFV